MARAASGEISSAAGTSKTAQGGMSGMSARTTRGWNPAA